MPRDKEFQRKRKDTRMPIRDPHAEERMDVRQSGPDFEWYLNNGMIDRFMLKAEFREEFAELLV